MSSSLVIANSRTSTTNKMIPKNDYETMQRKKMTKKIVKKALTR